MEFTSGVHLTVGWEQSIADFRTAYLDLAISITTKIHIIFYHLESFLLDKGFGLGLYNEQAFESVHADVDKKWRDHKIKDPMNPRFGAAWKKTICEYNSSHL
jgi:hypothetical protein